MAQETARGATLPRTARNAALFTYTDPSVRSRVLAALSRLTAKQIYRF